MITTLGKEQASATAAEVLEVLLVEDDVMFAKLLGEILQRVKQPKLKVTTAANMAETELMLAGRKFDVVLLDITLPDSRGIDTVKKVRSCAPTTPIVVMTGLDHQELALEALKAGAQDYLIKGHDVGIVVRGITYAVERFRTQEKLLEAERSLKAAQLHLVQTDRLESVGQLAAGLAHEIKNPLAIIQMGIDRLKMKLGQSGHAEAETLQDMGDAVDRAFGIINSLLNYAAPGSSARRAEDLNQIIREAVPMVKHEVEKRGHTLALDLQPSMPALLADHKALQQVFVNLLANAAQAMPGPGSIKVTTRLNTLERPGDGVGRRVSDYFRVGQQVIVCEVDDTGPGIPPDVIPRLCTPFFTTKPQGQGTGLGLYVTRNIVELHGGRFQIGNRPEGGARVTITLVV